MIFYCKPKIKKRTDRKPALKAISLAVIILFNVFLLSLFACAQAASAPIEASAVEQTPLQTPAYNAAQAASAQAAEIPVSPSPEVPSPVSVAQPSSAMACSPALAPSPALSPEPPLTLDTKIRRFLNKEGAYSSQSVQEQIFALDQNQFEEETKLGFIYIMDLQCLKGAGVEGILLSYVKRNDSTLAVVGFDGKDDSRFVSIIEIPFGLLPSGSPYPFGFPTVNRKLFNTWRFGPTEEADAVLGRLIDKPVILHLAFKKLNWVPADTKVLYSKPAVDDCILPKRFCEEANLRSGYARALCAELWSYEKIGQNNEMQLKEAGNIPKDSIVRVETLAEIDGVDRTKLPMASLLAYYQGE